MPVPTLPGTHWPAPLWFFMFLDYGGEALADFAIAVVFVVATVYYLHICKRSSCWKKCICKCTCVEDGEDGCRKRCCKKRSNCAGRLLGVIKELFTWGSRRLNVHMFPGLFKEHKKRDNGKQPISFLLFLDREVEDNKVIIFTFYFLALAIFSTALLVFFRYIPVEISRECLIKDVHGPQLYCYTNESSLQMNSALQLPEDCATYNSTEIEERKFTCYSFSIFDLGIAIAAAVALAKVATVGITLYVRVIEGFHMWSQKNKIHFWFLHIVACIALFFLLSVSNTAVILIIVSRLKTGIGNESERTYLAYAILPFMLLFSLVTLLVTLNEHCNKEQFISYCICQSPGHECCDAKVRNLSASGTNGNQHMLLSPIHHPEVKEKGGTVA